MFEQSFPQGRAWIELDHDALRHNVETLRSLLPPGCALMPAVKANAYGHGAVPVARELNRLGIDAFCVATAEEGAELRENGVTGEILVLGYTHPALLPLLTRYDLTQTVLDTSYAEALTQAGQTIKVHIAVDTGMHRLGEPAANIERICNLFRLENLNITGMYTHLCVSDTDSAEGRAFTLEQGEAFYRLIAQLRAHGYIIPKAHLLASYGLLRYPALGGAYARVGIALYGQLSTREDTEDSPLPLRPVLTLKARVAAVKTLRAGEAAGYGLQFTAARDTRLAVLAIGYADGIPRALSCEVGSVLIDGQKAPIVGRICMDQTLVDVTKLPDVIPGAVAILIGQSGNEKITACDLAAQAVTISNELFSRLGHRLPRIVTATEKRTNEKVMAKRAHRNPRLEKPDHIDVL